MGVEEEVTAFEANRLRLIPFPIHSYNARNDIQPNVRMPRRKFDATRSSPISASELDNVSAVRVLLQPLINEAKVTCQNARDLNPDRCVTFLPNYGLGILLRTPHFLIESYLQQAFGRQAPHVHTHRYQVRGSTTDGPYYIDRREVECLQNGLLPELVEYAKTNVVSPVARCIGPTDIVKTSLGAFRRKTGDSSRTSALALNSPLRAKWTRIKPAEIDSVNWILT